MKLIKLVVLVIGLILVFNWLGMFNKETSEKVDNAIEITKTHLEKLEYKNKPIIDMSLKELSNNISSDIKHLKEEIITEKGVKLGGKGISVIVNPKEEKIITAQVDPRESKAVETIENLIYNMTKTKIEIPKEFLDKGNVSVEVEKVDGEYNVSFIDKT